jgi:hypothetical protein
MIISMHYYVTQSAAREPQGGGGGGQLHLSEVHGQRPQEKKNYPEKKNWGIFLAFVLGGFSTRFSNPWLSNFN